MEFKEQHSKKALGLLASSKTTLSKGAKLAKTNIWEFADLVKEKKIVWIKDKKFIEKDTATKLQ